MLPASNHQITTSTHSAYIIQTLYAYKCIHHLNRTHADTLEVPDLDSHPTTQGLLPPLLSLSLSDELSQLRRTSGKANSD